MLLAVLMLVSCLSPAWAAEGTTYVPGTYTGEAQGFGGLVTVEVDFSEEGLTDVRAYGPDETEKLGGRALEILSTQFMGPGEIDTVSGATVTSDAFYKALDKALEAAGVGKDEAVVVIAGKTDNISYTDAEQVLKDLGIVNVAPDCGQTDWEARWKEQRRQEKADRGMPWPDGINVTLNGEFLTLDGVEPVAVENRTMVPVRAFLETLGAEVDYKDGVISVKLENGDSMEMRMDSTVLVRTVGDKINEIEMGVAPYARDGRVFIPARFAGEAMGLDVAWDSDYHVAHFTDWEKIAAEVDGRFTVLNALLGAEPAKLDPAKTYALNASTSGAATLYGETERENGTAKLEGTAKGLIQGGKLDLTYGVKLDLGGMREMLTARMGEEELALLELLSDFRVQLRGDLGEGMLYLKGNKLDQLPESPIPGNTWISMDLGQGLDMESIYEEVYAGLEAERSTIGQTLVGVYGYRSYAYGGFPPCQNVWGQADLVDLFFGDKNFKTSTAGNTTTYTLKMDAAKLAVRYREIMGDELEEVNGQMILDVLTGGLKADYQFTARLRDGKLMDNSLSGEIRLPASVTGSMPVAFSFAMSGDGMRASWSYTFKGDYIGKLEMKTDIKLTETTQTVPTAPAAGEKVVDMEALMGTDPAKGLSAAMRQGLDLAAGLGGLR